jgi:DNA-binding GntR family transcriptional regulator
VTVSDGQADGPRSVVVEIREAIVRGDFVPNQRLVEADLSEQFAASRATVRSALVELANEGLVERVQNRGARVRAVSLAEAVEISEVRMVLEGLCAAKAAEHVTREEAKQLKAIGRKMRAAVSSGDVLGYSQLNQELHRRVREISGQQTAQDILERLRAQSVRHQFKLAMAGPPCPCRSTSPSSTGSAHTTPPPRKRPSGRTCGASSPHCVRWTRPACGDFRD